MLVCVMQMIPTYIDREVEQTDDILHRNKVYFGSEEEAAELEKIQINFQRIPDRYPEDYPDPKMN